MLDAKPRIANDLLPTEPWATQPTENPKQKIIANLTGVNRARFCKPFNSLTLGSGEPVSGTFSKCVRRFLRLHQLPHVFMITIVDYQMGNLRSVQKAIERVGGTAKISSDPHEIADAEKLILPGVGAFGDAMVEINRRHLADPIRQFVDSGRPFLGICLGLQLLFERGFEHGEHEGLGILAGDVVRFDIDPILKVPHMGWNTVTPQQSADGQIAPLLEDIDETTHFYFVHSYFVRPTDPDVIALTCDYGGDFCAMVRRDNLYATQFHPEKSQSNGLKLLGAFNDLSIENAAA